jgi:hypothetical protein
MESWDEEPCYLIHKKRPEKVFDFCEELLNGWMGYPRVPDKQQPLKASNKAGEIEKKMNRDIKEKWIWLVESHRAGWPEAERNRECWLWLSLKWLL